MRRYMLNIAYPLCDAFMRNQEKLWLEEDFEQIILDGFSALKAGKPESRIGASILCSIAESELMLGYERANVDAKFAFELASLSDAPEIIIRSWIVQSDFLLKKADVKKALELTRKAESLYRENCLSDRLLLGRILVNELCITTHPLYEYGPDSCLLERIMDIYMNENKPVELAWALLQMCDYILEQKPQDIDYAKMYIKWIEADKLPENHSVLSVYRRFKSVIESIPTPKPPEKTFLTQYGSLMLGMAATAGIAAAAYVYKNRSRL
jgi:hypothetical protein